MKELMVAQTRNNMVRESLDVRRRIILAVPPVPTAGETFGDQIKVALQQVQDALADAKAASVASGLRGTWEVVQQTIFLKDYVRQDECQERMRAFYGKRLPVNIYVPQPPCDGQMVVMEVFAVFAGEKGGNTVDFRGEDLVIVRNGGTRWYFCRRQDPRSVHSQVYKQATESFTELQRILSAVNVPFQNVIRTWLYLGGITDQDLYEKENRVQRYQELNRGRSDFFRGIQFFDGMLPPNYEGPRYPASTGIGATGNCLVMSALGITYTSSDAVQVVPLENPQQVPASAYGQEYSPRSPKFARAMAVSSTGTDGVKNGMIFVSGTASITDSESRHDGDPAAQTELTLDNIRVLIEEENLARHGMPKLGCGLNEMEMIRVYIKYEKDYPVVKAVCERLMPDVQKLYTFSDVCRPELLVEIEGVAFTREK